MAFPRIRTVLTHIAAAVVGALVGIMLTHWVGAWFRHGWAEVAVVMADQAYNAGNEDKAILILSQATAKDPDYYEPFNYLGRIYSHKGNQALALEMYQKALEVFDQEGIDRKTRRLERDFITKNIDTLQKQLSSKRQSAQHK